MLSLSTAKNRSSGLRAQARSGRGRARSLAVVGVTVPLVVLAACGSSGPAAVKAQRTARATSTTATTSTTVPPPSVAPRTSPAPTTTAPPKSAPPKSATPSTSSAPTTTLPPLASAGAGFVAGHVTAVGDSVMLDYQTDLQQDVTGVDVQAAVSRQWSAGEEVLQQLRAEGQLGSVVVVALGTNGPITDADFDAMMSILAGASRVVFVNIVVDKPWQDPNDQVLSSGVARYPNTVLANWYALESQNPDWVYSDGTHLPIGGPGAQALAALIASEV